MAKKKEVKEVAEETAATAEAEASTTPETPKKFLVEKKMVTGFAFNKKYQMKRIVDDFDIESDKDLSNDPEARLARINDALYFLNQETGLVDNDKMAIKKAYHQIEEFTAQLAVDVEYENICCKGHIAEKLRNLAEDLRELRTFQRAREKIFDKADCLDQIPDVMPHPIQDYDFIDGKFVKKTPDVDVRKVEISAEQRDKIQKVLSEITGEDLTNAKDVLALKCDVKK